jgi:putative ABC transport system permease protein
VIVLTKDTNEKLFGGQNSVGKTVRMDGIDYTVLGVLGNWKLRARYYDLTNGAFADPEEFFMPFTTAIDLKKRGSGNNSCFKSPADGWDAYLESDCVWMQMWVQLDSPARLAEYKSFLDNYVNEQKKLGRFERPLNNRLLDVNAWMKDQKVVSRDVEVQTGLGFAFLAVCLVNTIGLLLAKFTRKAGEIGLRRALHAVSRRIRRRRLERRRGRPFADWAWSRGRARVVQHVQERRLARCFYGRGDDRTRGRLGGSRRTLSDLARLSRAAGGATQGLM